MIVAVVAAAAGVEASEARRQTAQALVVLDLHIISRATSFARYLAINQRVIRTGSNQCGVRNNNSNRTLQNAVSD